MVARQSELVANYEAILAKVVKASGKHNVNLVAVSKFKPASDILALYNHGVRHFGENYVQELVAKSEELPKDIKWHFIGTLQTDKCKVLAKIQNMHAIETIDSLKKCKKLETIRQEVNGDVINVYLQVNTSGESQKSGFQLDNLDALYESIEFLLTCKYLKFEGLMTIGSLSESISDENMDFKRLVDLKNQLDAKYNLDLKTSMGMSNDFEEAIKQGSTSVRVGSSIFGLRPVKLT